MNFLLNSSSAADIPAENPNEVKKILANGVTTPCFNSKPAVINYWSKNT